MCLLVKLLDESLFSLVYCPIGHYCPQGSSNPIGCEAGSYADVTHLSLCKACPAGYYCLANATTYADTSCPKGSYCPENTTSEFEFMCPAGTYNNVTGAQDLFACLPCPRE